MELVRKPASGRIAEDMQSPVWIDIRPSHGLETARPGRYGRWRGQSHLATLRPVRTRPFKVPGVAHEGPYPAEIAAWPPPQQPPGPPQGPGLCDQQGPAPLQGAAGLRHAWTWPEPRQTTASRLFDAFAALQRVFPRLDFGHGIEILSHTSLPNRDPFRGGNRNPAGFGLRAGPAGDSTKENAAGSAEQIAESRRRQDQGIGFPVWRAESRAR